MSAMASYMIALVAGVALTLAVASAYPAKDGSFNYNEQQYPADSLRSLDAIGDKVEGRPEYILFTFNQDEDSEKGGKSKYQIGTGTSSLGFGGVHTNVNSVGSPQSVHAVVDVKQTTKSGDGGSAVFGIIRKYPKSARKKEDSNEQFKSLNSITNLESQFPMNLQKYELDHGFDSNIFRDGYTKDIRLPENYPYFPFCNYCYYCLKPYNYDPQIRVRNLDSIGGGHLLKAKDEFGSADESRIARGSQANKRYIDSIGGGHLLSTKDALPFLNFESGINARYGDSVGGGQLLPSSKDLKSLQSGRGLQNLNLKSLDSIGGGHLLSSRGLFDYLVDPQLHQYLDENNKLKSLDSIGGGHLLSSKRNLNFIESGRSLKNIHLKSLDSIGGGHLLSSKGIFNALLNPHMLQDFDENNNLKSLDSIGGGHLLSSRSELNAFESGLGYNNLDIKSLDSIGGGHLLSSRGVFDYSGNPQLLRGLDFEENNKFRSLDSIGGGHLLSARRDFDSMGREHILRKFKSPSKNIVRYLDSISGGHLLSARDYLDSKSDLNYEDNNVRVFNSIGGGHLLNT